jgi:hypothetical protein
MKSIGCLVAVPKFHGLWTTVVCVALVSGGSHVMRSLRTIEAASDRMEDSFRYPSAVYSAQNSPPRARYLQEHPKTPVLPGAASSIHQPQTVGTGIE